MLGRRTRAAGLASADQWLPASEQETFVHLRGRGNARVQARQGRLQTLYLPLQLKAKSKGGKGKQHTISIKATDGAGNVGKPATVKFKVIRKG